MSRRPKVHFRLYDAVSPCGYRGWGTTYKPSEVTCRRCLVSVRVGGASGQASGSLNAGEEGR